MKKNYIPFFCGYKNRIFFGHFIVGYFPPVRTPDMRTDGAVMTTRIDQQRAVFLGRVHQRNPCGDDQCFVRLR